jgi:hypothetical protein
VKKYKLLSLISGTGYRRNMIDEKEIDAVLDEAQMNTDDRNDEDIPEAPAVSNIKVWIKGYGVMLTVRGEKMMDIIKKTETLIDYAESHGWKNVWDTTPKAIVGQPATPQGPVCTKHNKVMVKGKFGWYCQSKDDSEPKGWCRQKPPVEWAKE